jgi:hypothetical protein
VVNVGRRRTDEEVNKMSHIVEAEIRCTDERAVELANQRTSATAERVGSKIIVTLPEKSAWRWNAKATIEIDITTGRVSYDDMDIVAVDRWLKTYQAETMKLGLEEVNAEALARGEAGYVWEEAEENGEIVINAWR